MEICPICQTTIDTEAMDYKCEACGLFEEWWEGDVRHTKVGHHTFKVEITGNELDNGIETYLDGAVRTDSLIWRTSSMIAARREEVYEKAIKGMSLMIKGRPKLYKEEGESSLEKRKARRLMREALNEHNRMEEG